MIMMESLGNLLPTATSGKIVGIASYRGDFVIVACEYGLFKLWEDWETKQVRVTQCSPSEAGEKL